MSDDFDTYLRYRRPHGFEFAFPADKKFVWVRNNAHRDDRTWGVAEVLEGGDTGPMRIRMRENAEERVVQADEVEGVNPAKFDGVEDCALLGYLSQPSVLHNLRLRYDANCIYTHSGLFTVAINPYKLFPIYTDAVVQRYVNRRRGEVPPHVFSAADEAYRQLLRSNQSQSMLVTGESGAGKTENTKRIIQYLASVAGRSGTEGTLEKQLLQANPLLEALGNAKTLKNNNSSRFGKFIRITFDSSGYLSGASIVSYLLETSRVVQQGDQERSFHIFYQLMHSPAAQRTALGISSADEFNYLNRSGCTSVAGMDDAKEYAATLAAMSTLQFTPAEQQLLHSTIAGIMHLGNTEFVGDEASSVKDRTPLERAAALWQVDAAALEQGLVAPTMVVGRDTLRRALSPALAARSRDALAKSIYNRLFLWVVDRINATLHVHAGHPFIGLLDIAGFEIFKHNSFEQLCINFTNERLQQFFNNHMFHLEQEEYKREKIEWTFINFGVDSQATIDLLSKKPRGILALLDEQTVFPRATDETFVALLQQNHGGRHPKFSRDALASQCSFAVDHYAGRVDYDATLWLEKNKDPLQSDLQKCLQSSRDGLLADLMVKYAITGQQRGTTFMTVGLKYREQLDDLMDTLGKTYPHFIRCIIPNHRQVPGQLDDEIVLEQLACNGVLEGIRISRLGFPNRLLYAEFFKRYYLLMPSLPRSPPDAKAAVRKLLDHVGAQGHVTLDNVRYGVTKIFFRAGELARIEEQRERVVGGMVLEIQALARAYVARKSYALKRARSVAGVVIQKAIRDFIILQEDAWWRMFTKVRSPAWRKIADQESELRVAREKVAAVERARAEVAAAVASLREKAAQLTAATEEVTSQLREQQSIYASRREDLAAELADLASHKSTLDATEGVLHDTEGDLRSRGYERQSVEASIRDVQAQLSTHEAEQRRLEHDVATQEAALNKLRSLLSDEQLQQQKLSGERSVAQSNLENRHDILEELINKKGALTLETSRLDGERLRLEAERSNTLNEKRNAEKRFAQLTSEVKDTRPKAERAARARAEEDQLTATLQPQIGTLTADADEAKQTGLRGTREVAALQNTVHELTDDLEAARKASKKVDDAMRNVRREEADVAQVVSSIAADNQSTSSAVSRAETRRQELTRALNDAHERLGHLTRETASLTIQCEELTAQLTQADSLRAELERNHKLLESQMAETTQRRGEVGGDSSKSERSRAKYDLMLSSQKEQQTELRARRAAGEQALVKSRSAAETLRQELEQAQALRDKAVRDNATLSKDVHALGTELVGAQQSQSDIEKKLAAALRRRSEQRESLDNLLSEREALQEKQVKLTDAMKEVRQKLEAQRDVSTHIKTRTSTISEQSAAAATEQTRLEREGDSLERKLRGLENDFKELRAKLLETEDAIASAKKEGGALEVSAGSERLRLQQVEVTVERIRNDAQRADDAAARLEQDVASARTRESDLQRDVRDLQDTIADRKEQIDAVHRSSDGLRKRILELEVEAEDINDARAANEKQTVLDEKCVALRREIGQVRQGIEDSQSVRLSDERERLSLLGERDILRRHHRELTVSVAEADAERSRLHARVQHVTKEAIQVEGEGLLLQQRLAAIERKLAKRRGNRSLPAAAAAPADAAEIPEGAEQPAPKSSPEMTEAGQLRATRAEERSLANALKNERRSAAHLERQSILLDTELAHLRAALTDANHANLALRRHQQLLESEVADAQAELEADRGLLETLRDLSEAKDAEIKALLQQLATTQAERDASQVRTAELKRELILIRDDIDYEARHTASRRADAQRYQDEPEPEPVDSNESIRRQIARYKRAMTATEERLKNVLVAKSEQDGITWRLQETYNDLQLRTHDAEQLRLQAEKEVASLHKQMLKLREEAAQAEADAERSRFIAQEAARDVERLRDELLAVQDAVSIGDAHARKHGKTVPHLQAELDLVIAANTQAANERVALDLTRRSLKRQLADERAAHSETDAATHRTMMDLERARNEMHLARAALANLEREVADLTESHRETVRLLSKATKRVMLEGDAVRAAAQLGAVRDELEAARRRTAVIRSATLEKESEAEALQFDLKTLRYDVSQLRMRSARMAKAQAQLRDLIASQRHAEADDEFDADLVADAMQATAARA